QPQDHPALPKSSGTGDLGPQTEWVSGVVIPPPPEPKNRLFPRIALAVGILVALLAISGGLLVFFALRGTGDVLTRMAPSDTLAYATVYLDPAAGQKLNLRNLADKFPGLADRAALDRRINGMLDQALSGWG